MYLPVELNIYDKFLSEINLNLKYSKFFFDKQYMDIKIEIKFHDFIHFKDDIIKSNICQDFFDESLFKNDNIVYNTFDVGKEINDNLSLIDDLFIDVIEL